MFGHSLTSGCPLFQHPNLRREGLGDRTIHNRVGEVVTFLRHFGIKDVTIRVKFVEQKVRAYRPDELKTLFVTADPEEWILFQFFLCTGAREQEVACKKTLELQRLNLPVMRLQKSNVPLQTSGCRGSDIPNTSSR